MKSRLRLKKADYDLLVKYIYSRMSPLSADFKNAEQLYEELQNAEVFENENEIPPSTIAINSLVEVQEKKSNRLMKFRIVLPAEANMAKQKLSIFAPLSIALMGYRQGDAVIWEMPSGPKTFLIKTVCN